MIALWLIGRALSRSALLQSNPCVVAIGLWVVCRASINVVSQRRTKL